MSSPRGCDDFVDGCNWPPLAPVVVEDHPAVSALPPGIGLRAALHDQAPGEELGVVFFDANNSKTGRPPSPPRWSRHLIKVAASARTFGHGRVAAEAGSFLRRVVAVSAGRPFADVGHAVARGVALVPCLRAASAAAAQGRPWLHRQTDDVIDAAASRRSMRSWVYACDGDESLPQSLVGRSAGGCQGSVSHNAIIICSPRSASPCAGAVHRAVVHTTQEDQFVSPIARAKR